MYQMCIRDRFPILHLGRPWLAFWLFPYPDTMGIEPNFRSPLVWDVFAVSTYATVSVLFWFVGLLPDLATLRDRTKKRLAKIIYGIFAMGWRGSAVHLSLIHIYPIRTSRPPNITPYVATRQTSRILRVCDIKVGVKRL